MRGANAGIADVDVDPGLGGVLQVAPAHGKGRLVSAVDAPCRPGLGGDEAHGIVALDRDDSGMVPECSDCFGREMPRASPKRRVVDDGDITAVGACHRH